MWWAQPHQRQDICTWWSVCATPIYATMPNVFLFVNCVQSLCYSMKLNTYIFVFIWNWFLVKHTECLRPFEVYISLSIADTLLGEWCKLSDNHTTTKGNILHTHTTRSTKNKCAATSIVVVCFAVNGKFATHKNMACYDDDPAIKIVFE